MREGCPVLFRFRPAISRNSGRSFFGSFFARLRWSALPYPRNLDHDLDPGLHRS
jgi:hypothetical protein